MPVDRVWLARVRALAAADAAQAARRDVMPLWYGQPEDARVCAASDALVAFDPFDQGTHLDELDAQLRAIRARLDAAYAARDAEWQAALDEPRPTLRRLMAEVAKAPAEVLSSLAGGNDDLAEIARRALATRRAA